MSRPNKKIEQEDHARFSTLLLMLRDRNTYLAEALRSHIDSFGSSAEQLRAKIETSIQSIGADFWKHNTERRKQ